MGMNETYAAIVSALFDEIKRQQAEVANLIKRLESSVAAVEDTGRRLPKTIGAAAEARMETAARQAFTAIASNWTEAKAHAERAAAMYRREASCAGYVPTSRCLQKPCTDRNQKEDTRGWPRAMT